MHLPRSTYYDAPPVKADDAEIVAAITAICNEFEAYGYRRVGAELRHQGIAVNSKKGPPPDARARLTAQTL
jgi:putative transposase